MSSWTGVRALVTGGTGTIGSAVVRRLLRDGADVVRILSRDDSKQFELQRTIDDRRVRFLIGDVRDRDRLIRATEDINLVVHAAAMKHVSAAEYNPFEAVETNVGGTQNVINAALTNNIRRIVLVSTDKVVAPLGVYGATKLLAERLFVAADWFRGNHDCLFTSVRFGNVVWSRGSIVPALVSDLRAGRPLTLTDPTMTRFLMSIDSAIDLIERASEHDRGGETFIARMRAATVQDIANAVVEEFATLTPEIRLSGRRIGEREHELLLSAEEAPYAGETRDGWILGQERIANADARAYSSEHAPRYSIEELRQLLRESRPSDSALS